MDRPPVWLREGFNIGGPLQAEPMGDVLGAGVEADFVLGWKRDPQYRDLFHAVSPHASTMRSWSVGGCINRFLMIPEEYIHRRVTRLDADTVQVDGVVETPAGPLTFRDHVRRGLNTYWHIEHLAGSPADLEKLASVPFELPAGIEGHLERYESALEELGEEGILRIEYPSPVVAISAAMSLEDFLAMTATDRPLLHDLLEEVTRRLLVVTDGIFAGRNLSTVVNLGGSEQCTPPLMAPEAFDELVVPYDGRIVERLKDYGVPVIMHCHGRVRHALSRMVTMGIDATDPVEPPPSGDLSIREAREIAGDRLTLIGNLEFDELENAEPSRIRTRVKEILSTGTERLVLGASAGPISAVTPRLARNYKAWIEAWLEYR